MPPITQAATAKAIKTIVVVTGPTGSGKTALAIAIAQHFGTSVVSADSRQIYKGMAIGTAQPTPEELAAVDHHFIASCDITEECTAGKYERDALRMLEKLFQETDIVVVAGGSGLYIDALCHGMNDFPETDAGLRAELAGRLRDNGLDDLLSELEELDPEYYESVDKFNPVRIIRALEVCRQTGRPYSEQRTGHRAARPFGVIKIATDMPREELYERINRRVDEMVAAGLEQEVRNLYPYRELQALQTVGYRELFDYFDGTTTYEEAIDLVKRNSRRYAKRQMTWLRRYHDIAWFDPSDHEAVINHIENELAKLPGVTGHGSVGMEHMQVGDAR